MRSRTSSWIEVDVRYNKVNDEGFEKPVTERYVVDALSFSEGEASAIKEMQTYVTGDLTVRKMNPAAYGDIFFSDADTDDRWYKAKLKFIYIDENSNKEKFTTNTYLVQGSSLESAVNNVKAVMNGTMIDYVFVSVSETNIIDVFEHKGTEAPES